MWNTSYKSNRKKIRFPFLLTSAGNGVNSWPVVLYNSSGSSLNRQDASHLQDDILRRCPARQSACQLHPDHLRRIDWRLIVVKKFRAGKKE